MEEIAEYFEQNDRPEWAERIRKAMDRENELSALEYAGVDNWSGYYERWEMLKENFPETYERLRS